MFLLQNYEYMYYDTGCFIRHYIIDRFKCTENKWMETFKDIYIFFYWKLDDLTDFYTSSTTGLTQQ